MALQSKALPFGLRQVKVTPLGADGATPGASVALPVAQTLSFAEVTESEQLRGDDTIYAEHDAGASVEWELEAGGIDLAAYAVIAGGTVSVTGVAPNQKRTYTKMETDGRPYFKIQGRAISDNGGDFHVLIYRAKANDNLEGELADQTFWITSASGVGFGSLEASHLGKVYDFIQNETATAVP